MTVSDIAIPQMTAAEWREAIAKKANADLHSVDDVLDRHGIEVHSIAPRRKCVLLHAVRLSGTKSGLVDPSKSAIPDQEFDFSWSGLGRGLWMITSDRNSRGKSSVLNAFKAAVKGKFPGSIKPDIWHWVSVLAVEFSIDEILHRVTVTKRPTEEGVEVFRAALERSDRGNWVLLSEKASSDEFEQTMSDLFMQELGFQQFHAFKASTDTIRHHGWSSMGSALFLSGATSALFGEEIADGLPLKLLQLFIGLPWISTQSAVATALKRVDAESARVHDASSDTRAKLVSRIDHLVAERASIEAEKSALPDREKAISEKRAADRALTDALEDEATLKREVLRLEAELSEAEAEHMESRNLLQQVKDEVSAGYVFRQLRPKTCPSCDSDIAVENDPNSTGHNCSLCGHDTPEGQDDSFERIDALKGQVSEAKKSVGAISETLQTKKGELELVGGRIVAAEAQRASCTDILSRDDGSRDVEVRLIGVSARIQELQESLPPESTKPIPSSDARILKAAEQITKECYSDMQSKMLEHFSRELFRIAREIGVENLQQVEVSPGKIEITQGNTLTTFGKLNPGERLRFRTAAALAAVATAKWSGVGRHPGFIVLDSPAAQEMSEDDFAALLGNLSRVVEEHEDMQVIVGAVMRPRIKDVVSCERMKYAEGDAHLF